MFWKNPIQSWRRQQHRYQWLEVTGKLITWTEIQAPPQSFATQGKYLVGIIDCGKKGRTVAQLVEINDTSQLKPGLKLTGILRRLYEDGPDGIITYGVKFRPIRIPPLNVRGG